MKKLYASVLLVAGLVGCGNQGSSSNQALQAAEERTQKMSASYVSPLPDDAPVVKAVTQGTMPPFNYQDDYGNLIGLDVDVLRTVGEEMGFKVEFYQDTWTNLFPSVVAGQRDVAISSITYTDDRNGRYGLSDSYLVNPSAIMYVNLEIPTQNGVASLSSLQGKRVGVMTGTSQEEQIKAVGGSQPVGRDHTFLLLEALAQGEVDAILQDAGLLRYYAANYPQYNLKVTPYEDPKSPEAQSVMLLAKENTELLAKINEGIAKIKANGKLKAIEDKYFDSP